jgi:uncharacterized protein
MVAPLGILLVMDYELLCQIAARHRVQQLELFGSVARNEKANDVDFLVRFLPMSALEHGRAYFALLDELQNALNTPVDLLDQEAVTNPFFLQSIASDRKVIYAA